MRDGRLSKLTEDGERLLDYARRMVRLNDETVAAFDDKALTGRVRIGVPDDYADRFLPEVLSRFARTHTRMEVNVTCAPTPNLADMIDSDELDLAIITYVAEKARHSVRVCRREPLLWVTSSRHDTHLDDPLPLALGQPTCRWRRASIDGLSEVRRPYRVVYSSWNSSAVAAAVIAGLAVSVLPECALRPGMRVLTDADGFPKLPMVEIGLVVSPHAKSPTVEAFAGHIISSLDNLSLRAAAE
jgi:DNA-binding transcriptional LysR family regulator